MSSNIAQSYPYTTETDAERQAAVAAAVDKFDGLRDKVAAEADPLPDPGPAEPGKPHLSWVFVCPKHFSARLHVAGYARERKGLYTVCDAEGETYLR